MDVVVGCDGLRGLFSDGREVLHYGFEGWY